MYHGIRADNSELKRETQLLHPPLVSFLFDLTRSLLLDGGSAYSSAVQVGVIKVRVSVRL